MTARRMVAAVLAVGLGIAAAGSLRPFLWPAEQPPLTDGPVLVLGGGQGRTERGVQLLPDPSEARPLLLSHPDAASAQRCGDTGVSCIHPEPVSTWGEAQAAARLARAEGWPALTVVTERFHLTRSRSLFERCLDVPVHLVASDQVDRVRLRRALPEAAAALVSAVLYRSC